MNTGSKMSLTMKLGTFLVSLTFSFTMGIWWYRYIATTKSMRPTICPELRERARSPTPPQLLKNDLDIRGLLFIGVITSQSLLKTRAQGVYDTWGKDVPGRLVFFAGRGNTNTSAGVDFPVIYLNVPDDVHPPQRKSLAMLKYIHDNFIDNYRWFIRSDDDVYIRTGMLVAYLAKIDSSQTLLLGQAGQGKKHEKGKLGLADDDNFCIGGPSIIMTRGVLKKVTPHLEYCVNNTATYHEDTEVGRCLRRFAGVMCPWAYQGRNLFHHVYVNQDKAYHYDLAVPDVNNAITLHPIKDPAYMRRLHVHFATVIIRELEHKAWLLSNRLNNSRFAAKINHITSRKRKSFQRVFIPKRTNFFGKLLDNSSLPWEQFNSRQVWSVAVKAPLRWIHDSLRDGLLSVVRSGRAILEKEGEMKGYHGIQYSKDIQGYSRYHPLYGQQFTIGLKSINIIQEFAKEKQKKTSTTKWFYFQQPHTPLRSRIVPFQDKEVVHFVVSLAGRIANFERFLSSFENAFLKHDKNVKLLVVYFPKLKHSGKHKKIFAMYKKKYPFDVFHWLDVNTTAFQRGRALNMGSKYFSENVLLSFVDVDLVFDAGFLQRCRINTVSKKQVYFPIMFSKFHPNITKTREKSMFAYRRDDGLWRIYSYGPVCVYKDDVSAVRGFNMTIKGWGLEDVDFFEKFLKNGKFTVFRAPDRGLMHVYHKHAPCSPKSTFKQQKMCRDAIAAYLSSASSALDRLFQKRFIKKEDYF